MHPLLIQTIDGQQFPLTSRLQRLRITGWPAQGFHIPDEQIITTPYGSLRKAQIVPAGGGVSLSPGKEISPVPVDPSRLGRAEQPEQAPTGYRHHSLLTDTSYLQQGGCNIHEADRIAHHPLSGKMRGVRDGQGYMHP